MSFDQAVAYYGSQSKLAEALGISKAAVSKWTTAAIPMLRQYQLEKMTGGKLKADHGLKSA